MKLTTPANRMELARALGRCNPLMVAYGIDQLVAGESWACRDDEGRVIAVAGICELDFLDHPQIWMVLDGRASRHILPLVRLIRLTLEAADYHHVECRVRSKAGRRIAKLCGLKFARYQDNLEIWTWK